MYRLIFVCCLLSFGCTSEKTIPLEATSSDPGNSGPTLPTGGLIASSDALVAVVDDILDVGVIDLGVDGGLSDAVVVEDGGLNAVDSGVSDSTVDESDAQ